MIREEWEEIKKDQSVRQNLSKLRQAVKEKDNLRLFLNMIKGEEEKLASLLKSEDAKTRKNAALLMGDLGRQEFLDPIYHAYEKEEQLFVKGSYLSAIGKFDYGTYLKKLKERLQILSETESTKENQKHVMEEMRELSSLIVRVEGISSHSFTGWNQTYDIVLLTNRNFTEDISSELKRLEPNVQTKLIGAGVMARVQNLNWLKELRTYQELLFVVKGMKTCPIDASQVAEMVLKSDLLSLLERSHEGTAPYYFRVEMKSKRLLDEKSAFVKKLSGQIEHLSGRKLINSTDHYEIEFRLIENKEGNCNILVKFFTLKDRRFTYRKEVVPTSIKPVNAALTVALAKEYMKEDAQVLDPFCGVGTMLIERHKAVRANTTYGVDIQEDAILKAKKNTETAGQVIHYINRDFFRFQHEYQFDEVITNMPFQIGRITEDEVFDLYKEFFTSISGHLKKDALIILYSHNKRFTELLAPKNGFYILKEYEISRKEGTYVILLKMKDEKMNR